MKVKELIEKLQKEEQEEQVVIILDDRRSEYYIIEERPLLHAGPSNFTDTDGNNFESSVTIIPTKKK